MRECLSVCGVYTCVCSQMMICVSERSNVFLKDPTDLMTNMYGDTLVTTNGKITPKPTKLVKPDPFSLSGS